MLDKLSKQSDDTNNSDKPKEINRAHDYKHKTAKVGVEITIDEIITTIIGLIKNRSNDNKSTVQSTESTSFEGGCTDINGVIGLRT